MREFLTPNPDILFNKCDGCIECCANYPFVPIFLEEFEEVYTNFPIYFASIQNDKFALAALYETGDKCRYLQNNICAIYEKRPGACKIFPIIPIDSALYYDASCSALNYNSGTHLFLNSKPNLNFYHHRLENFAQKRANLAQFLDTIWDELTPYATIKGVDVLVYQKPSDNLFLKYHQSSIKD